MLRVFPPWDLLRVNPAIHLIAANPNPSSDYQTCSFLICLRYSLSVVLCSYVELGRGAMATLRIVSGFMMDIMMASTPHTLSLSGGHTGKLVLLRLLLLLSFEPQRCQEHLPSEAFGSSSPGAVLLQVGVLKPFDDVEYGK